MHASAGGGHVAGRAKLGVDGSPDIGDTRHPLLDGSPHGAVGEQLVTYSFVEPFGATSHEIPGRAGPRRRRALSGGGRSGSETNVPSAVGAIERVTIVDRVGVPVVRRLHVTGDVEQVAVAAAHAMDDRVEDRPARRPSGERDHAIVARPGGRRRNGDGPTANRNAQVRRDREHPSRHAVESTAGAGTPPVRGAGAEGFDPKGSGPPNARRHAMNVTGIDANYYVVADSTARRNSTRNCSVRRRRCRAGP